MCTDAEISTNYIKYCICIENGKKATDSQYSIFRAIKIIKSIFASCPCKHLTHTFILGNFLQVLDFISRQGIKLNLKRQPDNILFLHSKTENQCLDHFCWCIKGKLINYVNYKRFLKIWMNKFTAYKLEKNIKDNYNERITLNEVKISILFQFFMCHGKCIGKK